MSGSGCEPDINLNAGPDQVSAGLTAIGSTGSPASCHAAQPPVRARAFFHPACLSSCATRALVASFSQAQ